jgi:hypothetical protein
MFQHTNPSMTELFPRDEKPPTPEVNDVDNLKSPSVWEPVWRNGLIAACVFPVIFLLSFRPLRGGGQMFQTIPGRIIFSAIISIIAVVWSIWKRST